MFGLCALLLKDSKSGMMFAAALAARFFKDFVDGWVLVDAVLASSPSKRATDPEEDGYKAAAVVGMLGVTVSVAVFAVLTYQRARDNMKDAAVVAGFTAWMASDFVQGWYIFHDAFEKDADADKYDDGFKAATVIAGLFHYAAWLVFGYAAVQLKEDGPGIGPTLFFAALSCWTFALGTSQFADYDEKAELQTDEDTLKAGQVFAGLALTAAWLAAAVSAVQFKERKAAMFFVLGFSFIMFAYMCETWQKYDVKFEDQDNEDTLKAGAVFEALSYTLAWLLYTAAAVLSLSDEEGIVFYGSSDSAYSGSRPAAKRGERAGNTRTAQGRGGGTRSGSTRPSKARDSKRPPRAKQNPAFTEHPDEEVDVEAPPPLPTFVEPDAPVTTHTSLATR